jgi:hypothetical protein
MPSQKQFPERVLITIADEMSTHVNEADRNLTKLPQTIIMLKAKTAPIGNPQRIGQKVSEKTDQQPIPKDLLLTILTNDDILILRYE